MPAATKHIRISVTPQLEKFVMEKVRSGGYDSASEVIREALRVLQKYDLNADAAMTDLRTKIDSGYAQAVRGELSDGDAFFDRLENSLSDQSRPRKRARR